VIFSGLAVERKKTVAEACYSLYNGSDDLIFSFFQSCHYLEITSLKEVARPARD